MLGIKEKIKIYKIKIKGGQKFFTLLFVLIASGQSSFLFQLHKYQLLDREAFGTLQSDHI